MSASTYYITTLIATVIGFTLTIVSILHIRKQLIVIRRNREVDLLVKLYQMSIEPTIQKDFDFVWDLKSIDSLTQEQRDSCQRVCLFFEMVGSILGEGYADTVLIENYFGSLVTGCYDALRMFIERERTKPYNNNFALNFENLAALLRESPRVSRSPGVHDVHLTQKDKKTKKIY